MNELLYYDLRESAGLPQSLATHLARELGRRIVAGTIKTGNLIEDEDKLAKRFCVSRAVVRDGVKILIGKGLLETRRGVGTKVRPRSSWGLLDDDVLAWHQSAPLNPVILKQLMDVRQIIEPKAAQWAAERGTDAGHKEIHNALNEMEANKDSIEEFTIADAKFHRSILRATNNEFLRAMEGVVYSALLSSIQITNRRAEENQQSIPFHKEVADAITKQKGDRARKKMELLLNDAAERLNRRTTQYQENTNQENSNQQSANQESTNQKKPSQESVSQKSRNETQDTHTPHSGSGVVGKNESVRAT